jgi:hypothetical protein
MAKYRVTIEEITTQDFEVEAENLDEAIDKTIENYKNGKFVLEPGNVVCVQGCVEDTGWFNIR